MPLTNWKLSWKLIHPYMFIYFNLLRLALASRVMLIWSPVSREYGSWKGKATLGSARQTKYLTLLPADWKLNCIDVEDRSPSQTLHKPSGTKILLRASGTKFTSLISSKFVLYKYKFCYVLKCLLLILVIEQRYNSSYYTRVE